MVIWEMMTLLEQVNGLLSLDAILILIKRTHIKLHFFLIHFNH
jgi:hypothetical protein